MADLSSFFDSHAPLELYESFAQSPVLAHFTFSSMVLGLINRIIPEISTDHVIYDLAAATRANEGTRQQTSMLRHVLALHIRRGEDWEGVCEEKGKRIAQVIRYQWWLIKSDRSLRSTSCRHYLGTKTSLHHPIWSNPLVWDYIERNVCRRHWILSLEHGE